MEPNRFHLEWKKSQDLFEMRELGTISRSGGGIEVDKLLDISPIVVASMSSHDGRNWVGQTADSPFSLCYLGDNQDECREVISTYVKHNLCTVRKCASEIRVGVWGTP
jgi:hypothetical protein